MPALPAVSKVVRVDHHMSQTGGAIIQSRLFFQYSGTLNTTDATTWNHNIAVAWAAFCTSTMSTSVDYVKTEMTDLTSNTAPQVVDSTGGAGGVAGSYLTAGTAMVIQFRITRRYRGSHPRIYIPGQVTGNLASPTTWQATPLGIVVGDFITFKNAAIANTNPVAIGTITHVNVSYYQNYTNHTYPSGRVKAIPTLRVTPLVDQIVGWVGNATVASQRRRNEQP